MISDPQPGRIWPNGGIHPPELGALLTPYLGQSVTLYARDGSVVARLGPSDGLLGWGGHFLKVSQHCHPDDRPSLTEITAAVIDSEPGWCGGATLRLQRIDGTWGRYEVQAWNHVGEPPLDGIVVRMAEVVAPGGNPMFGPIAELGLEFDPSIAAAAGTASLTLDRYGTIRHVTPAAEKLLGHQDAALYGEPVERVLHLDDRFLVSGQIATMRPEEERTIVCRLRTRDDAEIPVEARLVGGVRDPLSLITVVLTDRRRDPELVRLATTDPLTGLANRSRLLDVLTGMLGSELPVSVLYADVDGLKRMNDAHGHAMGDELIVRVARLLDALVGEGCTAGRIGGDEFVVVGPGDHPDRIGQMAEQLRREGLVPVEGFRPVRVSVGVARSVPGDTPATLLARADAAMFVDKREGRRGSSGPPPTPAGAS